MFIKKTNPKILVNVTIEEEDRFSKSTSEITDYGDLYSQLMFIFKNQGKVMIDKITESELNLTTVGTIQYDVIDKKVEGITQLIENFIKEKAIKMKAHAVFLDGKLIQVYTDVILARFEKQKFEREGKQNIEIREIFIK